MDTTLHTGVPRRKAPIPQQYQPLDLDMTPIYGEERQGEQVAQENEFDDEKTSRVQVNIRLRLHFFIFCVKYCDTWRTLCNLANKGLQSETSVIFNIRSLFTTV